MIQRWLKGGERPRWLEVGLGLFGLWLAVLVVALFTEHTALGRAVFQNEVRTAAYLALHTLIQIAAIAACVMAFVRGTKVHRLVVLVPLALMIWYGLMFIHGPG